MRSLIPTSSSSCLLASSSELTSWLFVATTSLFLVLSAAPTPTEAAPFSSWAGKRSAGLAEGAGGHQPDLAQLLHDLQELYMLQGGSVSDLDYMQQQPVEKRAPFSSWAGKRAPFSSWAGKRAPFSSWAGKRAPFSSWAGKRSGFGGQPLSGRFLEDEDDSAQLAAAEAAEAKHRIKRSSVEDQVRGEDEEEDMNSLEEHARQRRGANQFSAWGGKRNQLRRFTRNAPNLLPVKVMRPQRAAFSAWGG